MKKIVAALAMIFVGGMITAQETGIFNRGIPYYREYEEALQVCAVQPSQFRTLLTEEMNKLKTRKEQIDS